MPALSSSLTICGSEKIWELLTVTMRPVNWRLLTHLAGSAVYTLGG